jgi:hypothetical protein
MSKAKKAKASPFCHPQIERKFPSPEVHKLCNADTSQVDTGGESGTSEASMPIPVAGPN